MALNPEKMRMSGKGWHAQVIVSEEGEGWAVELRRDGDEDPVLVSPWTMGRNKVDPKPMNDADFGALIKAAGDFLARAERQQRDALRREHRVAGPKGTSVKVVFEVIPDESDPVGRLRAFNDRGEVLAEEEISLEQPFTRQRAEAWAKRGFNRA